MKYFKYKPSTLLAPYIEYYWTLELEDYCSSDLDTIRLPDHSPEWVFRIGHPKEESFITLNYKDNATVIVDSPIEIFAIRFRPYGMACIGNINMREFDGAAGVLPSDYVFPSLNSKFEDIAFSLYSDVSKIALMEDVLKQQLAEYAIIDKLLSAVVNDISGAKGNVSINKLCKKYNRSRATLSQRFAEYTGLSPKELARIYRFNHFVITKLKQCDKTFAEVALECGYYDQSHLNREFKSITGITPSRFFSYASSIVVK
jgi:AraC-like DNA-binding protein